MSSASSSPISQACAVPYRVVRGRIEVCIVTTMRRRRWTFPKGLVERGDTHAETALKEAWEEAGLRGEIIGTTLGTYTQRKRGCDVAVTAHLMQVRESRTAWPEAEVRRRRWVAVAEAVEHLGRIEQRELLAAALRILRRTGSRAG
jgi:8-oxo-dGTP pyrophosphatase MutT (NUDIX family)